MLTHDAATFHERRRQQPENRRDRDRDDAFYLRRLVEIGLEMTAMTRVPTLDWPSNLFADARASVTI
jgi:hypothetical protein